MLLCEGSTNIPLPLKSAFTKVFHIFCPHYELGVTGVGTHLYINGNNLASPYSNVVDQMYYTKVNSKRRVPFS